MNIANPLHFLRLNKTVRFDGNYSDFQKATTYCDGIKVTELLANMFKFETDPGVRVRFGALPWTSEPVVVYAEVKENGKEGSIIKLSTDIRYEYYYALIPLFILNILIIYFESFNWWQNILIPCGTILLFYFFHFSFRIRENYIAEILIKKLILYELHLLKK